MVMKSSSTIACMLVLVLVQATQYLPCVSARNLPQVSGLTNGFNLSNVFSVPTAPTYASTPSPSSSPTVKIPGVGDLTKGLTDATKGVTNAATGLMNGLSNALGAPPAKFSDATGLVNGVTTGVANAANGVSSALANATSGVANGLADAATGVTSGLANALGPPPPRSSSAPSTPKAEEAPGTTITETFYISSTGLGSTLVTATTHIPPLSEIQIPDLKSILKNLLPKQSSSPDSPRESTPPSTSSSPSPPPPTGFQFPGIPGFN